MFNLVWRVAAAAAESASDVRHRNLMLIPVVLLGSCRRRDAAVVYKMR